MVLNSTARTALRAVVHIAEQGGERPIRVEEISEAIESPRNYLSKTLHQLAREGVLRSRRGPRGGFELVDSPDELTLATVVSPFTSSQQRRCLLGRAECSEASPCSAHHGWSAALGRVEQFLEQTTIGELCREGGLPEIA